MQATFLALYRGESVAGARLVALSADPGVVADFAGRLLEQMEDGEDAVVRELEDGRQRALRLVRDGAED